MILYHDRRHWEQLLKDRERKQGAVAASVPGLSPHSLAPSIYML